MINKKYIENNFEEFYLNLKRRNFDENILNSLSELISKQKQNQQNIENLRAKQNTLSKSFGEVKKNNGNLDELKNEISNIKEEILKLNEIQQTLDESLNLILFSIPNLIRKDTPKGKDEENNEIIKTIGTIKEFNFIPKEHFELAQDNNWIDFKRGVKLAKSRFSMLKNDGAKLRRALQNFMLDHNKKYGFDEVSIPYIANENSLFGTGQLPKFKDDLFKIEGENLFLIPTSEVALINIFNDEILSLDELPIQITAFSSCFRKEAGSAGKDTRGIIREHQFDKVEIVTICTPNESEKHFENMVQCSSDLLSALELPHRLVNLCEGDIGFCANKTIDLEVWLPGQNKYREISSVSNTLDFQARRAKIRYKENKKNIFVHTLNGSSLAIGRCIVAIMENYQDENGNISMPKVLKPYMS
jgi:seryl-tRNA synthetase